MFPENTLTALEEVLKIIHSHEKFAAAQRQSFAIALAACATIPVQPWMKIAMLEMMMVLKRLMTMLCRQAINMSLFV